MSIFNDVIEFERKKDISSGSTTRGIGACSPTYGCSVLVPRLSPADQPLTGGGPPQLFFVVVAARYIHALIYY